MDALAEQASGTGVARRYQSAVDLSSISWRLI
jgi:hypothetical protein